MYCFSTYFPYTPKKHWLLSYILLSFLLSPSNKRYAYVCMAVRAGRQFCASLCSHWIVTDSVFAGTLSIVLILYYQPHSRAYALSWSTYNFYRVFFWLCLCYPYVHRSTLIMISCTSWNNLSPQAPILKKNKKNQPLCMFQLNSTYLPLWR